MDGSKKLLNQSKMSAEESKVKTVDQNMEKNQMPRHRRTKIICPHCTEDIWTQVERNWINALKLREITGFSLDRNGPFCHSCYKKIPLSSFHVVVLDHLINDF